MPDRRHEEHCDPVVAASLLRPTTEPTLADGLLRLLHLFNPRLLHECHLVLAECKHVATSRVRILTLVEDGTHLSKEAEGVQQRVYPRAQIALGVLLLSASDAPQELQNQ